jgi:hypothetical protein
MIVLVNKCDTSYLVFYRVCRSCTDLFEHVGRVTPTKAASESIYYLALAMNSACARKVTVDAEHIPD